MFKIELFLIQLKNSGFIKYKCMNVGSKKSGKN